MHPNLTSSLQPFVHQKNILLTSYRKSGKPVPTTVHIVVEGERAFVRTWNTAGKFKRIRNNPEVEIAPSTGRGHPTGAAIPMRARMLSDTEAALAARLLARKYPLMQGILVPLSHRLLGVQTVHFELTPVDCQAGQGLS